MEIHLKINDVKGQDEKGRHILWINDEDLREWLNEHQSYVLTTIVQPMLKHHPAILSPEIKEKGCFGTRKRKTNNYSYNIE